MVPSGEVDGSRLERSDTEDKVFQCFTGIKCENYASLYSLSGDAWFPPGPRRLPHRRHRAGHPIVNGRETFRAAQSPRCRRRRPQQPGDDIAQATEQARRICGLDPNRMAIRAKGISYADGAISCGGRAAGCRSSNAPHHQYSSCAVSGPAGQIPAACACGTAANTRSGSKWSIPNSLRRDDRGETPAPIRAAVPSVAKGAGRPVDRFAFTLLRRRQLSRSS